ncbi:uncharacterized protein LOC141915104 [Tubulanus polymorphus]|uniref:uncharacterized protein LOC141915104 n=1 Tax=Tubulanus polymorphus TaxID=672921 RepID=UPI003DA37844
MKVYILFCYSWWLLGVVGVNQPDLSSSSDRNITSTTEETTRTNSTQWVVPTVWSAETFPNPRIDITHCGRRQHVSYICDPSEALAYQDADVLDGMIDSIRKNSTCPCDSDCPADKHGYMFSIAIVPKLHWKQESDESEELMQKFADDLRKLWNFGHCENDVLILIITEYKRKNVYSSVGSKAKEIITEECSNRFYARARKYFTAAASMWALGLESMLKDYAMNTLKGECSDTWEHGTTAGIVLGSLFAVIVLVSVVFMIIECIRRRYHEIRRKRKFHYAPSYSTAAVAQRRFPTSHSWSALRSNQYINNATNTSAKSLVTTGFAGLSGRMKINNPQTTDDKEELTLNDDNAGVEATNTGVTA